MADRSDPVTEPRHAADRALDLVRDRTAPPVTGAAQAAAIRQRIRIPLRFADGCSATATVVSFTGLSDAQQHVALELGRPAAARLPLDCMTNSTPTRCKIAVWIPTTRISRSATRPTSATTPAQPRSCTRSAPAASGC